MSESTNNRWLSLEQIRKQQRMRRSTVITAMESGDLPHERRGRIRYARTCDVEAWEERRLTKPDEAETAGHLPDVADLL